MKFAFIAKHRGIWPVDWVCEALGVSRGGFYAWLISHDRVASAAATMKSSVPRFGPASLRAIEPMGPGAYGMTCWRKEYPAGCIILSD